MQKAGGVPGSRIDGCRFSVFPVIDSRQFLDLPAVYRVQLGHGNRTTRTTVRSPWRWLLGTSRSGLWVWRL